MRIAELFSDTWRLIPYNIVFLRRMILISCYLKLSNLRNKEKMSGVITEMGFLVNEIDFNLSNSKNIWMGSLIIILLFNKIFYNVFYDPNDPLYKKYILFYEKYS